MSIYTYMNSSSVQGKINVTLISCLVILALGVAAMKGRFQCGDTTDILMNSVLIVLLTQAGLLAYNGFFKKISVLQEGLKFETPFSDYTLPWSSIRTAGAYKSSKNGVESVQFEKIENPSFLSSAWIYFSVLPQEQVVFRNAKSKTIVFPYRKEILEEIKKHIALEKFTH